MRLLAVVLPALVAAGCERDDIPGLGGGESGPRISFTSPDDGAYIESSSARVRVNVDGFDLSSEAIGAAPISGQGHYHWYLDGVAAGEGAGSRFLVTDLRAGAHEISARLFSNDHQPIPGVAPAKVEVWIPADAPRVSIETPNNGALVNASSVELTLSWENYSSEEWHAYVDDLDGDPQDVASDPTSVVTRLEPGTHEIFARLHHAGGDPLDPEVVDVVKVEIPVNAPTLRIVTPENGAAVAHDITLSVETANFDLDGNYAGGTNVVGQGHYHIYLDGYDSGHMWAEGLWADENVDAMPSGLHEIFVRLMNNDHTSIEPKIVDRIEVNVTDP